LITFANPEKIYLQMKKVFIPFLMLIVLVSCQTSDKKTTKGTSEDSATIAKAMTDTANYTTIEWLDSTYLELGKQPEGKEIELTFKFKNSGNKNLVIENVTAQCGCTIPEKPEKPIAPGEQGMIKAKFNGSGHGEIRKEVYVTANTSPNPAHTLTFHAELIKP
jgi:hypothetical protein